MDRARFARGSWLIAAATVVLHLSTARVYGIHRDEPYYWASGRRLAWGYVDHPPITPLLYRLGDALFGHSLFDLRIVPALLHGGTVLLTVLLAREFGATSRAQLVAGLAAAIAPLALTTGHFLGTVSPEIVAWLAISFGVVRVLNRADPRWWVFMGGAVGLGMLNKWTTALLVIGLAVGFVATPARDALRSRWLLVGAAVALALWTPNVAWQAQHHWPQVAAADSIRDPTMALLTLPFLIVLLGGGAVLAIPGLLWLARSPDAKDYRPFAIAFVVIVAIVMVTAGKPYYAGVFGLPLIAAGAASGLGASGWRVPVAVAVLGVVAAPLSMPLLPLATADFARGVNPEIGEMVGWRDLVDRVATVYQRYPGATIFTSNYSEAGSIEMFGGDRLPQPISGHMTYWFWGHPSGRSETTIVVGASKRYLQRYFGDVQLAATFHTPHGVHNEEDGAAIFVCHQQRLTWDEMWPALRHPR